MTDERPHGDRPGKEHDEDAFAEQGGGAFQRGQRAKRRGVEIFCNPFKDSSSAAARAWREGWRSVEAGSPGPSHHEQVVRRRRQRPPSQTCLAVETVLAIRRARKSGESITTIHRRFGISYQACWLITTRRSWKHLPEEGDTDAGRQGEMLSADGDGPVPSVSSTLYDHREDAAGDAVPTRVS